MTIKVLDAGSVERIITAIKVLDVGNVERTLSFVRVLDAGNVVREVFTAGGGTVGASITPTTTSFKDAASASRSANFTASAAGATAFAWGVSAGPGAVSAGGTSATATLTIYNYGDPMPISATFYCDVTVGGSVVRATCTMRLTMPTTGGGGGVIP